MRRRNVDENNDKKVDRVELPPGTADNGSGKNGKGKDSPSKKGKNSGSSDSENPHSDGSDTASESAEERQFPRPLTIHSSTVEGRQDVKLRLLKSRERFDKWFD